MVKLVFVFPGQGSQSVGMGKELVSKYSAAAGIYDQAGEALGRDIARLCFEGPEEELARTENAQVALFVHSMAVAAVLHEMDVSADVVTGHSLGEYSALCSAGSISFVECLNLVAKRGEAMGKAAAERPGAMAAILGLEDEKVEQICSESGEVWPVNYNSPGQLVVSGETSSVERAMLRADEAGAKKTVRLAVSGSFHSPLMRPAAGVMKKELATVRFSDPSPPFLSSISCGYEEAGSLADLLVRQVVSPVRWRQAVEELIQDGAEMFVEAGNGKALCGLIRRINRSVATAAVSDPESIDKLIASLQAGRKA